jgi:hypothetical protein
MNPETAIPHGFEGHYSGNTYGIQQLQSMGSMSDLNGHSAHMLANYGLSALDHSLGQHLISQFVDDYHNSGENMPPIVATYDGIFLSSFSRKRTAN